MARGQVRGRGHKFLDRFVGVLGAFEVAEERRAAEMRERSADVGLKEHDDCEHDVCRQVQDHPVDRLELQPLRQEIEQQKEAAAQRHLHGTRPANQQEQLVQQERDDCDVERIGPPDVRAPEKRGQPVHESTR